MGYDYTIEFLQRNRADVQVLEEAFKTKQVFKKEYEGARDCANEQKRINNVLRSLAVNYPDEYVGLRMAIRTWTLPPTKVNPHWTLCVGPAWNKMPGRKPGETSTSQWGRIGEPAVAIGTEYHYPTVVTDNVQMTKLLWALDHEIPSTTSVIVVEFQEEPPIDWVHEMFDEQWMVQMNGPTTLRLERK